MPKKDHIHTFVKYKKRPGFFRCLHPDCTAIFDKEFLRGKRALCSCGRDFILTREDLRRATPKCMNCSDTKQARAFQAAQSLIENQMAHTEEEPEEEFF